VTVLFVTHDQEEAMSLSDRIVVMQEGCVHQIGAPEDLFDSPADEFVASFVGKANFFEIRREGRALYFLRGTEIREPLSADRFEGEPVKSRACAKPSDIRISSPCADGILGRVESSLFLGASVVYYVRVGPYRFRVSTGRRGLAPGSEVSLSFKKVILF